MRVYNMSASRLLRIVVKKKPKLPEKWKGGRIERIGKYFHTIYADYKTVAAETVEEMKVHPIKAMFYSSGLVLLSTLYKTNPNENNFNASVIENVNELSLVGELIRNQTSEDYFRTLVEDVKDKKLRYWNLGFFSLICSDNFGKDLDFYEAHCSQLKPRWLHFFECIVDVGIMGHWINLERGMVEYDVNPAEWDNEGKLRHIL